MASDVASRSGRSREGLEVALGIGFVGRHVRARQPLLWRTCSVSEPARANLRVKKELVRKITGREAAYPQPAPPVPC